MSERVKTNVKVSSEVNTILHDLFNQIQYEFCEQYEQEIKRLTELCNKYEEEHKTTFETWQKDIKARETDIKYNKYLQKGLAKAHSIIKEVREYINKGVYNCDGSYILEILDKVGDSNE